ncbi:Mycocerosic acid synthase-like polyketide synthase (plasmid) [Sulfitobacter sp. DSM 110093]|nr:Mycocerosic acid synthase-like polyketide synthase [Sulfitobacter sp. DSM 110093]UOA34003.1 Mycocerosic acid synthase-like polyketide synthase [Sulfitobacter sp. DSM 110093]
MRSMPFAANDSTKPHNSTKIAIVGMAFRFPGAEDNPDSLWQMLCEQGTGIVEIPNERFSTEKFYDSNPETLGKSYTKWAGILPQIDQFDPKFFGLAPREAASMDPQQRLVLQAVYGALENAHIKMDDVVSQRTGVFVGVSQSDYKTIREMNTADEEKYAGTGYAMSIVANRVSHRLNLTGPSVSVDTACSSSLVALDEGVRHLQAGSCDMAFVSGVNVIAHPGAFVAFSKAGMLSPTGQLSAFDKTANGYVRGEGVGALLLKPLDAAMRDGNRIHAVIEATAVNQDGQTGTMTAPSPEAQIDVIEQLFAKSGRVPSEVGYAEAHGTGTPIGDPIEAGSIGQAIGRRIPDRKLYIGSIKPNVGHLESAAGMAGIIKAVLSLQKGEIPPNRRFDDPNPAIPLDALNLEVPRNITPFPAVGGERRAIVNSFGFGGTNASTLIASAPSTAVKVQKDTAAALVSTASPTDEPVLIPLTAASPKALSGAARNLLKARKNGPLAEVSLSRLAASLADGPAMYSYRAVILCKTEQDLLSGLEALSAEDLPDMLPEHVHIGQVKHAPKLVFTYSGQGNQSWDMVRDLMAHAPIFRAAIEDFDAAYAAVSGWSVLAEMAKDKETSNIDKTWVTQPALVAVQYGLSALWRHWGVTPNIVLGHSVGEVAATIECGATSLEDAVRYLSKRSTILDHITSMGAMAAVGLPPEDVEAMLPDNGLIDIAGRNGPGATTISGQKAAVEDFVAHFEATYPDTFIRLLKIDGAWHSYQLEEAEDWLRHEVGEISWSQPKIDFLSTVTGKLETRLDLDYCWQNLRQSVRYMDAIEAAIEMGATTFLEIGPHTTLKPLTASTALACGAAIDVVSSMSHKFPDLDYFAASAAELFVHGVELDWRALYGPGDSSISLPSYAWDTDRYWADSEDSSYQLFTCADHPLLGLRTRGPADVWVQDINISSPSFLKDHRYVGEALFPAAGYVDVMLAAGQVLFPDKVLELENVGFHKALFLPPQGTVQLQTVFVSDRGRIEVSSRLRNSSEEWVLRASAVLRPVDVAPPGKLQKLHQEDAKLRTPDISAFYEGLENAAAVTYGPAFATIQNLVVDSDRGVGVIAAHESCRATLDKYVAHPALLDGCMQTLSGQLWVDSDVAAEHQLALLPTGIARVRCYGRLPADVTANISIGEGISFEQGRGKIDIAGADGTILLSVSGLRAKEMPQASAVQEDVQTPPDFIVEELDLVDLDLSLKETPGRWLVLGEQTAQTVGLIEALQKQGADVTRLGHDTLGEDITDALADLLMPAASKDDATLAIEGVVFAWPLSAPDLAEDCTPAEIYDAVRGPVQTLLEMGVALHDIRGLHALPRIIIATTNVRPTAESCLTPSSVAGASVMATMRTLSTELPELNFRHIDVSKGHSDMEARLASAILCPMEETEIALHGDAIYAARLKVRARDDLPQRQLTIGAEDAHNFKVTMPQPGVIDRLDLFECPRHPLGADEVRIKVRAVGLNFRDIMAVTALLPEDAEAEPAWQNLGLEFSGDIVEVGEKVTAFALGDRVMGMGRNCLQRFLAISAEGLIPMHDALDYDAAVTIPSAFATAHYALKEVGRLSEGDKVLIHVATGGVGLAALQIAQAAGAEVFATAGNDDKRALLRERGVAHVMNSRSLDYADEIMALTQGTGVDLILNSLPGSNIDKGLDILAPYGRFLEIGKRDVYADHAVGMKAMRRNQSFNIIDLAAMGTERPELLASQMHAVMSDIREGRLLPLPTTNFPLSKVRTAFRYMSQAQHVGKVVVTFDEETFVVREDRDKPITFRKNASYLITGGTRGFTLAMADWMSRQGAGRLLLASRSGRLAEEDKPLLEAMRARGTDVREQVLDTTDAIAVHDAVLTAAGDQDKPLAGILHGAAVIKDTLITMMTPEVLEAVLGPKVIGAWALHQAEQALDEPLDFLISFSSISQTFGAMGQSNYVAANGFLSALADYRSARGNQGGTIDWGAIADTGFVARDEQLASYLETSGMAGLYTAEAEVALGTLLRTGLGRICYGRGDWEKAGRTNIALSRAPRFASMISGRGRDDSDLAKRLSSLTGDALVAEIAGFVTATLSDLLKVSLSPDDLDMPMSEAGLDSLSSFELKMRLETELGVSIMASHFLKAPTVGELSKVLAHEFEAHQARLADNTEDGKDEGQGASAAIYQKRAFTDGQAGMIATTLARFSSASTRRAFEHRLVFDAPEGVESGDLQKAIYATFMQFPLMGLTCDIPRGSKPNFALGEAPQLTSGHLKPEELLDVARGELLRFGQIAKESGLQVQIAMHAALGDAQALEFLKDALWAELCAAPTAVIPGKFDASAHLSTLAYHADTPQGLRDRSFWSHVLRKVPGPVAFSNRGRALGPEAMGRDHGAAQVKDGHLKNTLSEADMLLAYAGALQKAKNGAQAVVIARDVSARPSGMAEGFGPFTATLPIIVPVNERNEWEAADFKRILSASNDHIAFDVFNAAEEFDGRLQASGARLNQIGFALQNQLPPSRDGATYNDVRLDVAANEKGTSYQFTFDSAVVTEVEQQAIIAAFEAQLEGMLVSPNRAPVDAVVAS